ncbi:MAG: hypothetical protein OEZ29_00480 [Candidatus Bathyarchaeota archaeon]|nr:hypothetical protein [Candidatus Bathyarchaeota archaeon]
MVDQSKLDSLARETRLYNIIDMGLTFSAMIRLFQKGSKERLHERILVEGRNVFEAKSEEQFMDIHSRFCDWGIEEILLAEKKRSGRVVKEATEASYGQIAKTFDVAMKVVIYYSHFPSCEKSRELSKWLNAAVDTKMMTMLKKHYPKDLQSWPATVQEVDKTAYKAIQRIVRKFIKDKHNNSIMPVQFDDIYWKALNR